MQIPPVLARRPAAPLRPARARAGIGIGLAAALAGFALLVPPALAQPRPRPPAATAEMPGTNVIVAVVNGDIVTRGDVISRSRLFALNIGIGIAPDMLARLTPQVTRLMIDERLRVQEVQRRRIPVSDEDIGAAITDLERRNNLPAGGLRAQLQRAGVQPRVLFDQVRAQIGWARLLRVALGPQAEPTDADAAEAARADRARAGQPEFLVSEIFIPVENAASESETRRFVEDVVRQLRAGTPFPIAATQFSQSQTAVQGGDLGWVRADQLDPEVTQIVNRMPVGAVSGAVRVAGGFQIVALRQKRELGRDMATMLTVRQAFLPFPTRLDPENPTEAQRAVVERARAQAAAARSCDAIEQLGRGTATDRPVDPGQIRLESVNPPQLRALLAGLQPGRASQPVISAEGVLILMVCSREQRNEADISPDQAKERLLRERVELLSRQLQRDLRRRANIEMREAAIPGGPSGGPPAGEARDARQRG
jgi:peptidyl-prolyl cis-trans isomerase SurA